MSFVPYVFGVIGALLTATVVVLLNNKAGIEIHSLSILFIIPIGGILLGLGGAGGFFLAKKFTHTKIAKGDYIGAIILGFLTFIGVNYISYQSTYIAIDDSEQVIVKSQFSQPKDYTAISQIMSFIDYINVINSSSSHQLRYRGAKIGDNFNVGKTAASILFYIQILGVLLGSLTMALILENMKYCDNCKRYYKNKSLKNFNIEDFNPISDILNDNIENGNKLKKIIEKIKDRDINKEVGGTIGISYCPNCYDGYLIIKFFAADSKGEVDEVSKLKQEISLNSNVIKILST